MALKISIIIPVKPLKSPVKAIDSLKCLNYPENMIEVIKVSGWHPSRQRNMAVQSATGDILYFLDDDSQIPPDTLEKIAKRFEDHHIDVLGGPSIPPPEDSFLQQCFAECFASPFGGFNIRHRHKRSGTFRKATERALISCNLAIRREVFLKEKGFLESLYPNEENEFLDRLHSKGYGLFYDPDIYVYRSMRKSFLDFFRQIFTYGRGRMDQTFANPVFIKPYHFVPMFFVIYLFSLPFATWRFYFLPMGLYLFLNFLFSSGIAFKKRSFSYLLVMQVVFFLSHVAYGCGSLWGILRKILGLRRTLPSDEITVEVVKL